MHPIFKRAITSVVVLTFCSFYGFATGVEAPAPALDLDMTDSVEVLGQAGPPMPAPAVEDRYSRLAVEIGTGPSWSRGLAAQLLGEQGDRRAVAPLLSALHASDPWVATKAAEALGKIGAPESVPGLLHALQMGHHTVRREACRALVRIGDPRSRQALLAASKDGSDWVRRIAASAVHES